MMIVVAARDGLTDIEFRRARHVISEIDRTQKASALLQQGDYGGSQVSRIATYFPCMSKTV
jgi:galactokinase